jgi:N-hydroxyarylamine O-acetyltransferase
MDPLTWSAREQAAFLQRIECSEVAAVNLQTLRILHAAHVAKIPFETLDIFSGKQFFLSLSDLYDKIVRRRRGGYCYELNGFFFHALQGMGFEVSMHNAQLYDSRQQVIPTSQHMVLIVKLEEPWLVDVGYGNGFTQPLLLECHEPQVQGHRTFRCLQDKGKFIVQERLEGVWEPWYVFTQEPKEIADFEGRNAFHQTSRDSVFFGKRICMLARGQETIELSGNQLIRRSPSEKRVETVLEEEIPHLLKTEFGIDPLLQTGEDHV